MILKFNNAKVQLLYFQRQLVINLNEKLEFNCN